MVNATSFFVIKKAKKCPINNCDLMGPDCQNPYLEGITVGKAPFQIEAVANYIVGW